MGDQAGYRVDVRDTVAVWSLWMGKHGCLIKNQAGKNVIYSTDGGRSKHSFAPCRYCDVASADTRDCIADTCSLVAYMKPVRILLSNIHPTVSYINSSTVSSQSYLPALFISSTVGGGRPGPQIKCWVFGSQRMCPFGMLVSHRSADGSL